jgi:1,4-dihydroxy-6-naphthoate synthase
MKLKLGFSPCPNDTFIFDAMVHGRVDTEGLEFDYFLADVEDLNKRAFAGEVDITKISYHAYAYAAEKYIILDSGSALGHRNGPLLVCKSWFDIAELANKRIAIPGKYTTANLLFSIAWPEAINKMEYHFSDIEQAVLDGEVDAGLIIHETRFTYQKKGLQKLADMGEFWENLTGLPVPLGTIVIRRSLPLDIILKIDRIIKRSIEYAFRDSSASYNFVSANAREMGSAVMNKHIKLFVNDFSLNLGTKGRSAILELFRIAGERKIIPEIPEKIFIS